MLIAIRMISVLISFPLFCSTVRRWIIAFHGVWIFAIVIEIMVWHFFLLNSIPMNFLCLKTTENRAHYDETLALLFCAHQIFLKHANIYCLHCVTVWYFAHFCTCKRRAQTLTHTQRKQPIVQFNYPSMQRCICCIRKIIKRRRTRRRKTNK